MAYPPYTEDYQHEIELVGAIGKAGRDVSVLQAEDLIFGYAVGLEMTRRDRQKEARERAWPWEMGKSFDQSSSLAARSIRCPLWGNRAPAPLPSR